MTVKRPLRTFMLRPNQVMTVDDNGVMIPAVRVRPRPTVTYRHARRAQAKMQYRAQ